MGDAEPQCIDHYTIIRLLNENPICYTYLGKDEQRKKRYVIIKIFKFPLSTKVARESFFIYAKQLKKLRRNNITEIHNFGVISEPGKLQDLGYHVIEYIQDIANTEQYTSGNLFAPDQIKPFLSTIADTLQYAHVSQVMHGNLHPGNILFGEELRITDFSPMPQEFLQALNQYTTRGLVYKAPEHLHGILTPASDQYSIAVIVYEWICGQRPYSASNRDELLYQQEHEPIPSPRNYNSKISPNVEAVILKALSPEPADRFEHMLKFSDAYLRALMGFPFNDKKTVIGKQSIQPSRPQPAKQTDKSIEDPVKYADETPQIPEKVGEELSNIHPSSDSTIELQVDTAKKDELVSSNAESTINDDVVAKESNVHEKKALTEKSSKKKLSRKPFVNDFSHLNQIVSTDLGHGGILSERLQGYEERPAQIEMASLVARALMEEQHAIVEAATGTGKALDVDTPIPTPTGWKRMGDLVSGDFVFDEQGHPTRVTAAFDVMHDRTCYEVVFSDGSSIVADAEHEWATHTSVDRSWSSRLRTSTYAAKNFVTSDQLAMLEQLIALSQNDNTLSVGEATRLIGGHYWSVKSGCRKDSANQVNGATRTLPTLDAPHCCSGPPGERPERTAQGWSSVYSRHH